jgi:HSP20 family molecular chaperone IbpA
MKPGDRHRSDRRRPFAGTAHLCDRGAQGTGTGIFRAKTSVTGRFQYEVGLPGDIDLRNVTASYENGVVVIRAPKPESERTNLPKIKVQ